MRAIVGAPGNPGNIEFRDVEEPQPRPDELVLAVKAFAINRGELTLLATRGAGWRPGQDVSGVVVQAAANGEGPKSGERVVALTDFAGWSERVAARVNRTAVIPDAVSHPAAASLPVAGLTALRTLRVGGTLLGRRVLIAGASGGVGTFAVQLARDGGAVVTAIAKDADALRALGAAHVVPSMEDAPGEYDLILESVGGASLAGALSRVARNGTIVMFGNSTKEPTTFGGFGEFAARRANAAKLYAFFVYESGEPPFGVDLALLASLIAEKRLDPQIGATFDWNETAHAIQALALRRVKGKAVCEIP